jgi:ADP-ribosylglycohydrolase
MKSYFVYTLIDPRNNEEFYYATAKKNRKGSFIFTGDAETTARINEIRKGGRKTILKVIAKDLSKQEASMVENTLMWKLGKLAEPFAGNFRPHHTLNKDLPDFDVENDLFDSQKDIEIEKLRQQQERREKYLGCIMGGAIGDALGAPVEFMSYDQIIRVYGASGVEDYVEHADGWGEFTDDTQMLLFTAEGALRSYNRGAERGIMPDVTYVTYRSYLRWLKTQGLLSTTLNNKHSVDDGWLIERKELYKQRAPGNTCLSSLQSGERGTDKKPINNSKGCGTVMRIAPLSLVFNFERKDTFRYGVYLSALTHGHPSGFLSGGLLSSIIYDLKDGVALPLAIKNGLEILEQWDGHEEMLLITKKALEIHRLNQFKDIGVAEIEQLGQGWVAEEALAISLLCALHYGNDFSKAVLTAVNHSGDSDSTGAITGNIVGLMVGISNIPIQWRNKLMYSDLVLQIAEDLAIHPENKDYSHESEWMKKYPPN